MGGGVYLQLEEYFKKKKYLSKKQRCNKNLTDQTYHKMKVKIIEYAHPEIEILLLGDGTGICEESRFNSVDDSEYFGDDGELNL